MLILQITILVFVFITLCMTIAIYMKLNKTEKYTQNENGSIIACIRDYTKKDVEFINNDTSINDNGGAMQLCKEKGLISDDSDYGPKVSQAFPALNEKVVRDYLDKAADILPGSIQKYWLNTFYKVVFNRPPIDEYQSNEFDTACVNLGDPFWGYLKTDDIKNLSDDLKQNVLFTWIGLL